MSGSDLPRPHRLVPPLRILTKEEHITEPIIVGLDPSLTGTGIARSDGFTARVGEPGVTKLPIAQRSHKIVSLAVQAVETAIGSVWPGGIPRSSVPSLAVVELPNLHGAYGGQMERVGLFWQILRHLDGASIPYACPTPPQRAQFAAGKGSGVSKGQIIDIVTRRWPEYTHCGDDNIADAIVYMQMGRAWRLGVDTGVPKHHLAVLKKVQWPEM